MRKAGTFTPAMAGPSVSTASGRSKLARHASATLRDGTGEENGTTLRSLEA